MILHIRGTGWSSDRRCHGAVPMRDVQCRSVRVFDARAHTIYMAKILWAKKLCKILTIENDT
jgi:hypothetical protein